MHESRLRFGVLGAARIARGQFVPAAAESKLGEIVAIASRDQDRARAIAGELGIPRAYGSYAALLEDPDLDAVYIPLPNSLHPEWAIAAARAGKHVLCEKPVAARAADAERVARACQSAGVVLMEAFMWRHHPQHERVRELIASGTIGEPNFVRASFTYMIDPGLGDHGNVRLRQDLEGGALMDVGCYGVNTARWAFDSEPVGVIGQQVIDPDSGVDVTFAAVLEFSGDRLAVIDASFARFACNTYTLEGPLGTVRVEQAYRPDEAPGRIYVTSAERTWMEEIAPANQYAAEIDHFARSVAAGHLLPPAEDGVAQARVIEALYASAETAEGIALA